MATPLQKSDGCYALTDLFPGKTLPELGWDEFDAAVEQGLLPAEWQAKAREAMIRLKCGVAQGRLTVAGCPPLCFGREQE